MCAALGAAEPDACPLSALVAMRHESAADALVVVTATAAASSQSARAKRGAAWNERVRPEGREPRRAKRGVAWNERVPAGQDLQRDHLALPTPMNWTPCPSQP